MPCDTTTTQTLSAALAKGMQSVILDALRADGWYITSEDATSIAAQRGDERMTWASGQGLTIYSRNAETAAMCQRGIVQSYSKAAVSWAAKRAGWTVQSTGKNTMTVNRR